MQELKGINPLVMAATVDDLRSGRVKLHPGIVGCVSDQAIRGRWMSTSDAITTRSFECGGVTVLAVGGDVDWDTSASLSSAVDDVVGQRPAALIVDLSEVTFICSVGLRILACTAESDSWSGRFAVVADSPMTSRPIRLTKLDEIFAVYPTLPEALAALG
jgi:anti-sigma B factor antagonist